MPERQWKDCVFPLAPDQWLVCKFLILNLVDIEIVNHTLFHQLLQAKVETHDPATLPFRNGVEPLFAYHKEILAIHSFLE